jgi:hypothetical protein
MGCGLDSSGSGLELVGGSHEQSMEPLSSIDRKFLEQLSDYQLLKDSAPYS